MREDSQIHLSVISINLKTDEKCINMLALYHECRSLISYATPYLFQFHVAVRLFSNRSQMTSKCCKNKNVGHEAIAECVTDVLTTF